MRAKKYLFLTIVLVFFIIQFCTGCRSMTNKWSDLPYEETDDSMFICDTIKYEGQIILKGKNNQMFLVPASTAEDLGYSLTEKKLLSMPGAGLILWENDVVLMALNSINYKRMLIGDLEIPTARDRGITYTESFFSPRFNIVHVENFNPSYFIKFVIKGSTYNYYSCMEPFDNVTRSSIDEIRPVMFPDPNAYYVMYMPVWNRPVSVGDK